MTILRITKKQNYIKKYSTLFLKSRIYCRMKAGDISKGTFILVQGEPFKVIEREFYKPGKGSAYVKLKIKGLVNGQILRETFNSSAIVEEATIEEKPAQYLYLDNEEFIFMDTESFDQFSITKNVLEQEADFLLEGEVYPVMHWETTPISLQLPAKVVLTVVEAPEAIKGDTVSKTVKPITLETGLVIRAPLFIKKGEKIVINTETKQYVERMGS